MYSLVRLNLLILIVDAATGILRSGREVDNLR